MDQDIVGFAPTSMATTKATEPEVVAGISSGDLSPDQKLAIRADTGGDVTYGRWLMLLAAGMALGYGAARLFRDRG
jgi:hypothetical protein